MKKTKYIFLQMITQVAKVVMLDSDKVVRFESKLVVRYLRINNDGEVVMAFNEDPRKFEFSEERTDLFVSIPNNP